VIIEIFIECVFFVLTEVQEMEENMPQNCRVQFDDPSVLHHFNLFVSPEEGFWQGGKFKFDILVPDDYNIVVRVSLVLSTVVRKDVKLKLEKTFTLRDGRSRMVWYKPALRICVSNKV
jgi:hypothetical protein